jgi:mRNA-degrading endonuclease RelE of RelBE toxin-antitoxin system
MSLKDILLIWMAWTVQWKNKIEKQLFGLPEPVLLQFSALIREIHFIGPVRGNWKNYSKLGQGLHHCHLKTGRPTYVVCWEVIDKKCKIVEIYYVGTHEKAPY